MTEPSTFTGLLDVLCNEMDLDLRGYKHTTLQRRLRKRMQQVGVEEFDEYRERLRNDPHERNRLLETVLINVTEFFREPQAWEVIRQDVLPALFRKKRAGESFRVWVAACSTGEEAYSLAILVADFLGPRLPEFDIKIYATDIDDDALNVARRGEYPVDRLRRMHPDLRARYFQGETIMRVSREVRKMVIFGKNDLVHDAPISHVEMVVCRNVLIYFDSLTQKHVLDRLHYALDEGGVLFLGKSESKLSESRLFIPIHSRWRIFRRNGALTHLASETAVTANNDRNTGEAALLRLYQKVILDVLDPGVFILDARDVVIGENESARKLWGLTNSVLHQEVSATPLASRCPELITQLERSKSQGHTHVRFECEVAFEDEKHVVEVTLRTIVGSEGRIGAIVYADDISHRPRLQQTVEQLEATGEELQSANEELETTNEELQSTNEELETTNEELQSTNEELETTNEELQSLNEELENMYEELEHRTRELDVLNSRYSNTLEQMPWAVALIDPGGKIQFWNSSATRLFNMPASAIVGMTLAHLPIEGTLRNMLIRKSKTVSVSQRPVTLKRQKVTTGTRSFEAQIHLSAVGNEQSGGSVLITFERAEGAASADGKKASAPKKAVKKSAKKGSSPASKLKKKAIKKNGESRR